MSDSALALLAAVRGAGLVVTVTARDEILERLVEDLSRIGPIEYWPKHETSPLARLSLEQRCLLDLLSQGKTLAQAAQALHLSRRTADRYLASARAALGVPTTAEAVLVMRSSEDLP